MWLMLNLFIFLTLPYFSFLIRICRCFAVSPSTSDSSARSARTTSLKKMMKSSLLDTVGSERIFLMSSVLFSPRAFMHSSSAKNSRIGLQFTKYGTVSGRASPSSCLPSARLVFCSRLAQYTSTNFLRRLSTMPLSKSKFKSFLIDI